MGGGGGGGVSVNLLPFPDITYFTLNLFRVADCDTNTIDSKQDCALCTVHYALCTIHISLCILFYQFTVLHAQMTGMYKACELKVMRC